MEIRIALAGNPNSGKTTLFNGLTGSNQFVGNWPGVTVEKKEGKLKKHDDVIITDLPGIYSLSPYTLEEVVARNYLVNEKVDAILNIVDGTNLERNLYLTTQLLELSIPVVIAINMMDVVRKNGDKINIEELSRELGCKVVEISALKSEGIIQAAEAAIQVAKAGNTKTIHTFSGEVEHALAHIEEAALSNVPSEKQRWYSIKLFERDEKAVEQLKLDQSVLDHIEKDISEVEDQFDDDAESIITNERYLYIGTIIKGCYRKKSAGKLSVSDKIDRVVTNRFLALPIFAIVMFLVYYLAVSTVGTFATDWANDGLFGDGFHLFSIGSEQYQQALNDFASDNIWTEDMILLVDEAVANEVIGAEDIKQAIEDQDYQAFMEAYDSYSQSLVSEGYDIASICEEVEVDVDPSDYGIWVNGIPVVVEQLLVNLNCSEWLISLIVDGVVGGVGAVLGFLPQMIVLFILLAFLESCGYMARIAFVLDRVFRKFGLSGKSFIPMLIGTGCGVPAIMASRTIENLRDRRMTIITTTFIPCGAKLPIIALIAAALFSGAWWVAPSAYFVGIAAIIISGIMLKKTKMFAGDPAPFVMELPAYHLPTFSNIFRSVWERVSSFIKKASTIILLSSIVIWILSHFGSLDGSFAFSIDMDIEESLLGMIGQSLCWIFTPVGFGNIKATVATFMGLVAKEEVVSVFGILDFEGMSKLAAYSFLVFNLLCAPCFAAIGAIKREMNSAKWTWFAIGYQCLFAYAVSLMIYQFGLALTGSINLIGFGFALIVAVAMLYMLFIKKSKEV